MIAFAVAIKRYFGQKPNQTLQGLVAEIKELTVKDRKELAGMLTEELGEEVTP